MPGIDTYTSVMLHCDGTNNSTANLVDSSSLYTTTTFFGWPLAGNAKLSNTAVKFGTTSASFDGTAGTYAATTLNPHVFPSSDFTIDFWANFNATTLGQTAFSQTDLTSIGFGSFMGFVTSSATLLYLSGSSNTSFDITTNAGQVWGTVSSGVWAHWAVTRSGSTYSLFKDGTLVTNFNSTLTPWNSSANQAFILAAQGFNGAGNVTNFGNLFIDEFRFSDGIARWTANFTVPVVAYDQWEPGWDAKSDDWRRPIPRMSGY